MRNLAILKAKKVILNEETKVNVFDMSFDLNSYSIIIISSLKETYESILIYQITRMKGKYLKLLRKNLYGILLILRDWK